MFCFKKWALQMHVFTTIEKSSSCMLEYTCAAVKGQLRHLLSASHSWLPTRHTLAHPSFQDLLSLFNY